jgi:neural Wiskott-Aldrich syndrome protein
MSLASQPRLGLVSGDPVGVTAPEIAQIAMSPELTATLARSAEFAGSTGAPEVGLEHLLVALCDDPDAIAVLDTSRIDGQRIKGDVLNRVAAGASTGALSDSLGVSADVRRILEAASAAARGSRRRDINGAIVLAAIVGDARSAAAQILEAHGLTFENAIRALQTALAPREAPPAPEPPAAVADDVLAQARERVQSRSAPSLRDIMKDMPRPAPLPSFGDATALAGVHDADPALGMSPVAYAPMPAAPATDQPVEPTLFQPAFGERDIADEVEGPRLEPDLGPAPARFRPSPGSYEAPVSEHAIEPTLPLPSSDAARHPSSPDDLGRRSEPAPLPYPTAQTPGPISGPQPATGIPTAAPSGLYVDLPPRPQPSRAQPPPIPSPGLSGPMSRPGQPSGFAGPGAPTFGAPSFPAPSAPPFAPPPGGPNASIPGPGQGPQFGPQPGPGRPLNRDPSGRPSAPMGAPGPQGPPAQAPAARRQPRRAKVPNVEAAQLAENIPRSMRVGKSVRAEIRIAKASVKALTEGTDGAGPVWQHPTASTRAMSVRLRAPDGGFFIEAASPETQWIETNPGYSSDDFASWRFQITPQSRGWADLQIIVSARAISPDGIAAETALPDQIVEVNVRGNILRSLRTLLGWTIAAIIGGAIATFGGTGMMITNLIMKKLGH